MAGKSGASRDAVRPVGDSTDRVDWLRPIDVTTFRSKPRHARAGRRRWIAASLGASILLAVSAPGTAVGPASAHSRGDNTTRPMLVPPTDPADPFHVEILFENGPIGGELRDLIERAERERAATEAGDADEVIEFEGMTVRRSVVETILRAADEADVDPVYMMALADKESSFSVDVKASTSSAEGLFQFVAKTWLGVIREFGPKHGLDEEAAAVELVGGQPVVGDADMRERILSLRRDPYISALMAAELLKKDRAAIGQRLGRELTSSEFYLAHFFGAESAAKFLEMVGAKPQQSASRAFRAAAEANRTLFYARQGRRTRGLTVAEVYGKLDRMIDARLGRYRSVTELASAASPGEKNAVAEASSF